jgi:hypothetical protein
MSDGGGAHRDLIRIGQPGKTSIEALQHPAVKQASPMWLNARVRGVLPGSMGERTDPIYALDHDSRVELDGESTESFGLVSQKPLGERHIEPGALCNDSRHAQRALRRRRTALERAGQR